MGEIKMITSHSIESFEEQLTSAINAGWRVLNGQQMVVTYLGQKIDHNKPSHCNAYDSIQYSILITNGTSN